MSNVPFTFGPISQAVFRVAAFVWFCTEVGMFIEVRTSLGQERLYWPFWLSVCGMVLLAGLLADNRQKTP